MEIDIIKKTQTEAVQEMKILEIWAGIIGKHNQQNTRNGKENLSCLKFNRRNVCIGKKILNPKSPGTKHPRSLVH